MKILFLCTAHNSLSQRLHLALAASHAVTIEYALSPELMAEAVKLSKPDLIICPFLTSRVTQEIYNNYMTLVVHPGPPGDAGLSSLDWVLMGDDGSVADSVQLLESLNGNCGLGRSHWGVTVLQATEELDSGPVWAFEQFPVDIDEHGLTKSKLYRGAVVRAAVKSVLAAISRLEHVMTTSDKGSSYGPTLRPEPEYNSLSVSTKRPFHGGKTHRRPLLKANARDFDVKIHTSQQISRRIRSGDSQPGIQSRIFGINLYVYGGQVENNVGGPNPGARPCAPVGTITATRNDAVCIRTCDGRGVWITHVRRLKKKEDHALWPKVPAVFGLVELGILTSTQVHELQWATPVDWSLSSSSTFQEISIELQSYGSLGRAAYLYFDFYNGAMATNQCSRMLDALDFILSTARTDPVCAVVLMGGSYFSNGIALNVIEAASSPAEESWFNINRINDIVHYLLHELPSRNILTIAGIRGNAAAGGVALAAACDVVLCGAEVVLNPSYRGIGLHGSEYHSLSYLGRCGPEKARDILWSMIPLGPFEARANGLVDYVLQGYNTALDNRIKSHVAVLINSGLPARMRWKACLDLSPTSLATIRAKELCEMSKDFFSARSARYNSRRFNFIRKVKPARTPLRLALHRRTDQTVLDEEETDEFDDVRCFENLAGQSLLTQPHNSWGAGTPGEHGVDKTLFTCYFE